MLNEVKYLAYEREVFASMNGAFHAVPRSFAMLRMTESARGIGTKVSRTHCDRRREGTAARRATGRGFV